LVRNLSEHLRDLGLRPHSLVLHRDGRTYASELKALRDAVHELQRQGVLPLDIEVGVVEIRKSTADHLRIVEGMELAAVHNPTIGSSHTSGATEGIVCTTGEPFRFPGTAKPVTAVIAEGALRIDWVLEDIADLAQLVFTAPDRCARLPATIKLADDFLKPIASATDDEGALYDEDSPEDEDGADELQDPEAAGRRGIATQGSGPASVGDTTSRGGNRS
jgi:argonaute-like protein implicated in RNA metabolism and viral defense